MSLSALQAKPTYPETDIGSRVRIAYTNGCGQSSIRVIEPRRIVRGGNGYTHIRAWCHLRAEERTFRMDRVRSWEPIRTAAGQTSYQPSEQHAALIRQKQPVSPVVSIHQSTLTNLVDVESNSAGTACGAEKPDTSCEEVTSAGVGSAAPTTVSLTAPRRVRRRHPFRTILLLAGIFLVGRWLVISGTAEDILWSVEHTLSGQTVPAEHEGYMPNNIHETRPSNTVLAAATTPVDKTAPKPSPQPRSVKRFTYRGVDIIATPKDETYVYTAPAVSLSAASPRILHLRINAQLFRRDTGITDPTLEQLYAGADTDRDGFLCWKEIREFQGRITRRYDYQNNATALRPDEFLARGGGDCEDWALLTCGLLRYWGWDSYVAAFYPPGGGDGHALCMVRWTDLPRGFDYYTVETGATTVDGDPIRPGYYVPIDYEVVGGSSSAVKRGWLLTNLYTAEKIYGRVM